MIACSNEWDPTLYIHIYTRPSMWRPSSTQSHPKRDTELACFDGFADEKPQEKVEKGVAVDRIIDCPAGENGLGLMNVASA